MHVQFWSLTRHCKHKVNFVTYSATLDGPGDFDIGGQIIQTVKYADNLVLMVKEENVLQDMVDKLIEIGWYYGMEMNVEKTTVMRLSRQPSPVTSMIDQNTQSM
jgi:hypothetical protein